MILSLKEGCYVKKKIIISVIAIIVIIVAVLDLTTMFSKGKITGKLYRVDNVYEEIWNLLNSEKGGKQTILTTSVEGAEINYDFGQFQNVYIPVNDQCSVVLCFEHDELLIWIFDDYYKNEQSKYYVYNYKNNTLYGNCEESYLNDKFISLYYSWIGDGGKFNSDNSGNYTFEYAEFPLSHE